MMWNTTDHPQGKQSCPSKLSSIKNYSLLAQAEIDCHTLTNKKTGLLES